MQIGRRLEALLLAPLGVLLAGTVIVPAVVLFGYSLVVWVAFSPTGGYTAQNYLRVLTDPLYRQLLINTVWIALPTTIASVVGGYAIAYYIVFVERRGRSLMFALVVSALMASYLVRIFAWRTLLGSSGIVNSALMAVGLISTPLEFLLYSRNSAILAEVALFMPLAALTFYASLSGISSDYREAAWDLGAGRFQALWRVTLPLSGPAVLATIALVFFLSAGDYVTPVLVGGIDSSTLGTAIATNIGPVGNYGLGAALSIFLVALLWDLLPPRPRWDAGGRPPARSGRLRMRRLAELPWLAIVTIGLMVFLYAPLAVAVLYAFNGSANLTWPPHGFSTRWFQRIFEDDLFRAAFIVSIEAALLSSVISTFLGTTAAFVFVRRRSLPELAARRGGAAAGHAATAVHRHRLRGPDDDAEREPVAGDDRPRPHRHRGAVRHHDRRRAVAQLRGRAGARGARPRGGAVAGPPTDHAADPRPGDRRRTPACVRLLVR